MKLQSVEEMKTMKSQLGCSQDEDDAVEWRRSRNTIFLLGCNPFDDDLYDDLFVQLCAICAKTMRYDDLYGQTEERPI
jgi:hypothetical protein